MTRVAFLCPGQGAQHVGMGADLCREFSTAQRTFDEADEALGMKLSALCWSGPEDTLTLTENAQPALLTASTAVARILDEEAGIRPSAAAGHSLGEWSALVATGALDFATAVRAVRQRGLFMRDAVPPGIGGMAALLGADLPTAEELCHQASQDPGDASAGRDGREVVVPANLNGGGQIVVSGHLAAIARLEGLASSRRVRAMRLKVSAPFHSPLMAPARDRMRELLSGIAIRVPAAPVLSNVDATASEDPARIAERLCEQITAPVLWEKCVHGLATLADRAIEVGPGKVLTMLMRRIAPSFPCAPTADLAGVRAVLAESSR